MFINIADLKDPDDPHGRTYREVNNSKSHRYNVGDLVELKGGVRLIVDNLLRDCDGTPLYSLSAGEEGLLLNYFEEELSAV